MHSLQYRICLWVLDTGWLMLDPIWFTKGFEVKFEFASVVIYYVLKTWIIAERWLKHKVRCHGCNVRKIMCYLMILVMWVYDWWVLALAGYLCMVPSAGNYVLCYVQINISIFHLLREELQYSFIAVYKKGSCGQAKTWEQQLIGREWYMPRRWILLKRRNWRV